MPNLQGGGMKHESKNTSVHSCALSSEQSRKCINRIIDVSKTIENVITRIMEGITQSKEGFIDDSNCFGILTIEIDVAD